MNLGEQKLSVDSRKELGTGGGEGRENGTKGLWGRGQVRSGHKNSDIHLVTHLMIGRVKSF